MKTFETRDLGLATYLSLQGIQLWNVKVDPESSDRVICWFEFKEEEKCRKASIEYFNGQALVEPRDFQKQLKGLKEMTRHVDKKDAVVTEAQHRCKLIEESMKDKKAGR